MTEMVFGSTPVRASDPVLPQWWRTVDHWSLSCILLLFGVGVLLGLAASPPLAVKNGLEPFYYFKRQLVFGAVAMVLMIIISMLPPRQVRRIGVLGFIVTFVALLLLPVFGTDFGKGAVRWYSLGVGSVQPSEFLKPGFAVLSAWLIAASFEINGPPGKTVSFLIGMVSVGLLAAQPDFGQASLILLCWGTLYFVAGASITRLAGLGIMVAGGGITAYNLSSHFARRINGFLNPDIDPTTQIGYATNAIREGGFFGVGVGDGTIKWSLPDAHTDYIIAVAAEEYGFVLVVFILLLYLIVVVRSLLRLMRERNPFIRLAGTGLVFLFGIQAFVNMGVAVRLLPAKGMTLPFVSNGGSSVVAMGITLGMLLAFTRARPQGDIGDILHNHGG